MGEIIIVKIFGFIFCCNPYVYASDLAQWDPFYTRTVMQRLPYSTAFIETTFLSQIKKQNTTNGTGFFYIDHNTATPTVIRIPGENSYPEGAVDAYFDRSIDDRVYIGKCMGESRLFIITNKHVLKGKKLSGTPQNIKLRLNFLCQARNYKRKYSIKCEEISITESQIAATPDIVRDHPENSDLCAINVSEIIKDYEQKNHKKLLYFAYTKESIEIDFRGIDIYEDIAMIGYPRGLYDSVHSLPILRGGKISSVPNINWNNKPEFMIDCACIPGSSGSPVLLIRTSEPRVETETISFIDNLSVDEEETEVITEFEGNTKTETISYVKDVTFDEEKMEVVTEWEAGTKAVYLLGILHGGPMMSASGEIVQAAVPQVTQNYSIGTRIPINLGLVIKAKEIIKITY
jgi:V8-like Glu-specific endopeptidase